MSGKAKDEKPKYIVESYGIPELQAMHPGKQDAAIAAYINAKHAEGLVLIGVIGDAHIRFVFSTSQ